MASGDALVVKGERMAAGDGFQEYPRDLIPGREGAGEAGAELSGERGDVEAGLPRAHRIAIDPLYGAIPVSRWAQSLLELGPFRRLEGVSLSDVPGEILFDRRFPSRLDHSLGAYHLARQSRPRDRAVQAAALAHDLGHGPFSHLTEPLMIERLGIDHEQRSAALLQTAVRGASGLTARLLSWLDVDEVCALITGQTADGRGALVNGALDYDNVDNVARFAQAGELFEPAYDGLALARGLRPFAENGAAGVLLAPEARQAARAWQTDRATLYDFLQTDGWNVASHAMLRKAIDIAERDGVLDAGFFDLSDAGALRALRGDLESQRLVDGVLAGEPYRVIWEAEVPSNSEAITVAFSSWRERLALEDRLARESGLRPADLIALYQVSRSWREAPLVAGDPDRGAMPAPPEQAGTVRALVPPGAGQDYIRRARMAAERTLGALGVTPRGWPELR